MTTESRTSTAHTSRAQVPYPHPLIAREGWRHVTLALVIPLLITIFIGWVWALPFWLMGLFVVQFFRDPPRRIDPDENLVVSPADGRVLKVERAHDPYAQREAIKISVFMNVFNVHSNRSPVAGRVEKVQYFAGRYFNAAVDKSSAENERNAIVLRTDDGNQVTFVQIAGLVARRILCYTMAGRVLARGERYGFIRFGSRVDVYLPLHARPLVAIGDKVYATETSIAELPCPPTVAEK